MERLVERKRNSGSFWAYVLIIVGILWIMKKSGWDINLPGIGDFFSAIGNFFGKLAEWSNGMTYPILLMLAGILIIAGRRFLGALLLVILLLMVLPNFFLITGILLICIPGLFIILGIIILSKLFKCQKRTNWPIE